MENFKEIKVEKGQYISYITLDTLGQPIGSAINYISQNAEVNLFEMLPKKKKLKEENIIKVEKLEPVVDKKSLTFCFTIRDEVEIGKYHELNS